MKYEDLRLIHSREYDYAYLCDFICQTLDIAFFLDAIVESWQQVLLVHCIKLLNYGKREQGPGELA